MEIEEIKEWFDTADNDYYTAETMYNTHRRPHEIICYHCTQAVEKYLKGFILYNDKDINFTHNLSELINDCIDINSDFSILIQKCDILNKFSVSNLRYPPKIEVKDEDVEIAINIVKEIIDFKHIKNIRKEF